MDAPQIVVTAAAPFSGTWSSNEGLQIGRLADLQVPIDDNSVSRRHAEILLTEEGWVARDSGSTNGTTLNGVRIGRTFQRIRQGDVLRVGKIDLRIDVARTRPQYVQFSGGQTMQVEAHSKRSWDEAVECFDLTESRWKVDGKAFVSLMRAGYRLAHSHSPDEQFQKVLDEAVAFFGAQRGAIFLPDEATGGLTARCVSGAGGQMVPRNISRTPATRAYSSQHSLLFKDCRETPELQAAESVAHSSMKSIICAVLRSPDRTFGVLHLDRGLMQEPFTEAELDLADSLAAALALGVERLQMIDRQQEMFLHTVTALAQAVEMRDVYTGNHTHRVTTYAMLLAEELGVPVEERNVLRAAAALHDIGKIAIDDHILRKPGRLSQPEFDQMKTHVIRGSEIIQMVPGLAWALPVVRGHHERWDGTGYPDRLQGEAIPLLARIVCVVDAFDAMTSDRPYRPGMPLDVAYGELVAGAGRQFDPNCIDAFVRLRPRIEELFDRELEFVARANTGTDTISVRDLKREAMAETPAPLSSDALGDHATSALAIDDLS